MKSIEIRKKFLDFFKKHGHKVVPSSSLIPAQDPSLLFTNAGMNQFKDLFLGKETRSYTRATSIQKCVRAGGKHNDLDNVGFTKRHLTFFEMMGNFSFGNYFKQNAIEYAWQFLTQDMGFDPEKIYVTVYKDDDESYDLWTNYIDIPKNRITRLGEKDNFWQMGNTGPCGPCTEIYIDTEKSCSDNNKKCAPGCNCDRFLEVWNLVFMQYDQQEDGALKPLNKTGVDTGMGFERLCCIMQNVESVFETDLFTPLIKEIELLTGLSYNKQNALKKAAFHVLVDHIRSSSFIIADGCSPSNEGRGYVLRKIIRRAALFAQKLTDKNIFPDLAKRLVREMSPVYPELKTNETAIVSLLKHEIEQFSHNLIRGQQKLNAYMSEHAKKKIIPGEQAFKLYDTYGFPLEVTQLIAQERSFSVDFVGFEKEMLKQRVRSGKKIKQNSYISPLDHGIKTTFVGYETTQKKSPIIAILKDETQISSVKKGEKCWIIPKESPFFVSTGGQVDDTGSITIQGATTPIEVLQKRNGAIAIRVTAPTDLRIDDEVEQIVNADMRRETMNNHTATHLLQAALIELLGKQIKQSGSVVTPDYLRFDFTYHKNLSPEYIKQIEDRVNQKIRENITVNVFHTTQKNAIDRGVIAIFGEKYNPENVRVIDIPGFSAELCGGTHVLKTGAIGSFKIIDISALSAGNRRIVAVTGRTAVELMQKNFNTIKSLSQLFKIKQEEVVDAVIKQQDCLHIQRQKIKKLKEQLLQSHIPLWISQIQTIDDIPFLFLLLEGVDSGELKIIVTHLAQRQAGFYFIASSINNKSIFIAQASKSYDKRINLKQLQTILKDYGLVGGGTGAMIQGGGKAINASFSKVIESWLSNKK